MSLPILVNRDNLCCRVAEAWRPPPFQPATTAWGRFVALARRCLDLQAASIWRDLETILAACRGRVLDVGSGAQPYRGLLPADVEYLGIDRADAAERFDYSVAGTLHFEGDVWPVASGSVDTVLATEVLEHVLCPEKFLGEARRCLKPDGWLVLTVPFAARWHYIPHDYWRFTPSGLQSLLVKSGFKEPQVYARGNAVTVASYKNMALILGLLTSPGTSLVGWARRLLGIVLLPLLGLLAAIGQLSLRTRGGDDCLGYTVVAPLAPGGPA